VCVSIEPLSLDPGLSCSAATLAPARVGRAARRVVGVSVPTTGPGTSHIDLAAIDRARAREDIISHMDIYANS
jgi:hypothetical protein